LAKNNDGQTYSKERIIQHKFLSRKKVTKPKLQNSRRHLTAALKIQNSRKNSEGTLEITLETRCRSHQ
jgi:hypothetical protein